MTDLERALRPLLTAIVRDEIKRALADQQADSFLTTRAAAKSAAVSTATIRRWVKQGKLAAHRTGRTLRISRLELESLLKGTRAQNDDASPEELARRMFG